MKLTSAEIMGRGRPHTAEVELDDGGVVLVSELSMVEGSEFFERYKDETPVGRMACLIATVCVDEAGERLFSDEQIPAIKKWRRSVFKKVGEAAMRINGIGGEAESGEA